MQKRNEALDNFAFLYYASSVLRGIIHLRIIRHMNIKGSYGEVRYREAS